MVGYLAIACTIGFTVVGQLLFKLGMVGLAPRTDDTSLLAWVIGIFLHWQIIGGFTCALGAALCWMVALSRVPLSFAYPFMTLAIVLVLALSPYVIGEQVPLGRWLGVAVVSLGLVIASRA